MKNINKSNRISTIFFFRLLKMAKKKKKKKFECNHSNDILEGYVKDQSLIRFSLVHFFCPKNNVWKDYVDFGIIIMNVYVLYGGKSAKM